jgi:hypothetical protein
MMVVLSSALSPVVTAEVATLFWSGLGLGCLGTALLLLSRLPLYRRHQFLAFGPKTLPPFHRKLYRLAYAVLIAAVLLLGIVWLRTR